MLPKWSGGIGGAGAESKSALGPSQKGPMGQTFYEVEDAFKSSQLAERSTTINKNDRKTYISHVQRRARHLNNNFRFYDVQKGEKVITKGMARGWK